jgi:hypothetical protein
MRSLGCNLNEQTAQQIGSRLDAEKRGSLSYEQFRNFVMEYIFLTQQAWERGVNGEAEQGLQDHGHRPGRLHLKAGLAAVPGSGGGGPESRVDRGDAAGGRHRRRPAPQLLGIREADADPVMVRVKLHNGGMGGYLSYLNWLYLKWEISGNRLPTCSEGSSRSPA